LHEANDHQRHANEQDKDAFYGWIEPRASAQIDSEARCNAQKA
jgi:hypothetical protein